MASISDCDVLAPSLPSLLADNHPYGLSVASSASSSSSSILSLDALSSQFVTSSSRRLCAVRENEIESGFRLEFRPSEGDVPSSFEHPQHVDSSEGKDIQPVMEPPYETIAPEYRKHPRRTHRLLQANSKNGVCANATARPPPALVRQCERKESFVDSLVDTTSQMIETIWPISDGRGPLAGKDRNLIGLRTFVQEVLRRSKTSYSTLQVALYYLVLIKSCIPMDDFTVEQVEDSSSHRAMQCGRRMFLASLILASKYLQDRNFSSRAWSKISGLTTLEIHKNEMTFLLAVNWKLHIPEPVFNRWTDVVLKYSPSSQPPPSPKSSAASPNIWKAIIPHLTPDLDQFRFGGSTIFNDSGYSSPSEGIQSPLASAFPPHLKTPPYSGWQEHTPSNLQKMPSRSLKPVPRGMEMNCQTLPSLPRLGLLPTPTMTPQTGNFCTPAASAFGSCSGRHSMSFAMAQVQNDSLVRSTLDNPNSWKPILPEPFPTCARRSSVARSISSVSSPESMMSDVSTRSSRSSSISSVASSTCALPQPRLAVQATRRCANMKLASQRDICRPFIRLLPSEETPCEGLSLSPDAIQSADTVDFSRPFQSKSGVNTEKSSHSDIAHPVSTQEAAAALHDLKLNRQRFLPYPSAMFNLRKCEPSSSVDCHVGDFVEGSAIDGPCERYLTSRKRGRPLSTDLSVQANVRDLLAPRCLGDITNQQRGSGDDGTVLPDSRLADSFIAAKKCDVSDFDRALNELITPRKRACAGGDNREEAKRISRLVQEQTDRPRPGMWANLI